MKTIAFLGLGRMGMRMANRFGDTEKYKLQIWNRSKIQSENSIGQVKNSPKEAAEGADLVFSMVSNDKASEYVWFHESEGALLGAQNATLIECSTLSENYILSWEQKIQERSKNRTLKLIEAPVLGSLPQAEQGQLVLCLGGEKESISGVEEELNFLGTKQIFAGKIGMAAILKLAANTSLGVQLGMFSELLQFLRKTGFDSKIASDFLSTLPTTSGALAGFLNMAATRSGEVRFTGSLLEKDLSYFLESAQTKHLENAIVETARKTWINWNMKKNGEKGAQEILS
jgi:3-hydroxyisobutyrate dehydrogenase